MYIPRIYSNLAFVVLRALFELFSPLFFKREGVRNTRIDFWIHNNWARMFFYLALGDLYNSSKAFLIVPKPAN